MRAYWSKPIAVRPSSDQAGTVLLTEAISPAYTSLTPGDVTGLAFAVLSGTVYRMQFGVLFQSASVLAGIALTVTTPSVTILSLSVSIPIAADAAAGALQGWITASGDLVTGASVQATGTDYLAEINGVIRPSADGTVQVQAATSLALTGVTVRAGSYGMYWVLR